MLLAYFIIKVLNYINFLKNLSIKNFLNKAIIIVKFF